MSPWASRSTIHDHAVRALKGALLAAWRLARCNPLTPGGVDHVPDPGRWRYHYPHDVPRFEIDRSAG